MHAPYVLRTRTVSNAHGLYGVYDRSTALYGESPNAAVLDMTGGGGEGVFAQATSILVCYFI